MSRLHSTKRIDGSDPSNFSHGSPERRLPAQMRKIKIFEAIHEFGFVAVTDIAAQIGVSEMTIRRDLDELEREGLLSRTHGGAVSLTGDSQPNKMDREEPAYDSRLRLCRSAKERIAASAALFVEPRQSIALDVGTTTFLLAQHLVKSMNFKLFTNSLRIGALAEATRCDIYVSGGSVRFEELSVYGPSAVAQFEKLWFDVAFVGVSGVTTEGLFDYSMEDCEMKRTYLSRSSKKILLCDSSKFHRMSLVQVAKLDELDMLITEADPPADIAKALIKSNVELYIAREI